MHKNLSCFQVLIIPIITLSLFAGCNQKETYELPEHIRSEYSEEIVVHNPDQEPEYEIQIEPEQRFGDIKENDLYIGDFTDVAVDDAGRVFIADRQASDIKVFDPDGQLVTRLGREGQGPGDFSALVDVQINDNRLFSYDRGQQRSVIFLLDNLTYDSTIPLADNRGDYQNLDGAGLTKYHLRNDGTFLMQFSRPEYPDDASDWDIVNFYGHYHLSDHQGQIKSDKLLKDTSSVSVFVPADGRPTVDVPMDFFYGRSLTALSNDNRIFHAWTHNFLIAVYDPDGGYLHSFYYPVDAVPLTPESTREAEISEHLTEMMPSMNLPDTWPVLESMLVDDQNRIWVSVITENKEIYQWWVLDEYGELLARFDLPRETEIREMKDGNLYTLKTEEETGLQEVVRYEMDLKSK